MRRTRLYAAFAAAAAPLALALATTASVRPAPVILPPGTDGAVKLRIVDRYNQPLSVTHQNRWNISEQLPLWRIPPLIRSAAVTSEDKRFYQHAGVDWRARTKALLQNMRALRVVRGASTITEQVDRIIIPRRRTVWSRWIEGFEAAAIERRFSKDQILECYLNQLPYSANRRGIVQAASYYFNRDLETLNKKEMLALIVLARAPSVYERAVRSGPPADRAAFEREIHSLAARLASAGVIDEADLKEIDRTEIAFSSEDRLPVEAPDLVRYVLARGGPELAVRAESGTVKTTIDGDIQTRVNLLLRSQIDALSSRNVTAGAAVVIDHRSNQILAWSSRSPGGEYNNVLLKRQPGSALKPFLYALALESGWTAATPIADTPLARPVGHGLHRIRNYSNLNYGSVRLREALGNSLNIPAIRTVEFAGVGRLLERLHMAGFSSLGRGSDFYGEGLALGNGEVSLLELAGGYAALARGGVYVEPVVVFDIDPAPPKTQRVYSAQAASLISDILSDPNARTLEFGPGNILRFPVETAVKTGTSTDYRDAWAVGYSSRYTVAVWMGNLEQTPMADVTGSIGPALVLRAIFSELNSRTETRPLFRDPALRRLRVCRLTGAVAGKNCPATDELFMPSTEPLKRCPIHDPEGAAEKPAPESARQPWITQPTDELHLAKDPRIPDKYEAFQFKLAGFTQGESVDWIVDGNRVATTTRPDYLWPVERGSHTVRAKLYGNAQTVETTEVNFLVK